MTTQLSDSEKIVIREVFMNPHATLDDIATILNKERKKKWKEDQRFQKNVDVRTISKFKSVGLKKIRRGLEELASTSRLDLSLQNEQEERELNILQRNGILSGHDFRIDRKVYIFYTVSEGYILWQEHVCNVKCQDQCNEILNLIRTEHGLSESSNDKLTREHFEETFEEIISREM
ncbi:MAG: hypothetical protein JSV04_10345 [Candidatus Heimdallarchaeota archaeon]|nr:MAG: hypothetical protein JSV04_10345 [Candidatus Heimdallarchaeota archaeon]